MQCNKNRIKSILNDLRELWYKHPDLRLCQLLCWISAQSGWFNNDIFYIEDDVIAEYIKRNLE